ncbi:hypothetical protein F5Y17DRAFT_125656 [Xylariaceae sp. FL0594]|nr:hypothetical protein F5Y17DRAFT_125656 [Xylariaceae sp. FL0594]
MPPEIISLLSSSPSPPTSASATAPLVPSRQSKQHGLHQGLGPAGAPTAKTSKPAAESIAGTKRASSSNDFLFLSDDSDNTGDLDGKCAKKPRTLQSSSRNGKKGSPSAVKRASPPAVEPLHIKPLQSAATKKILGFCAEDIELSSSPVHLPRRETNRKASVDSDDPFASSQEKPTISTSRNRISKSPVSRSHGASSSNRGQGTWEWPKELPAIGLPEENTKPQKSGKPAVIDLSSDPFASSPPSRVPEAPPNARLKATWDPISSSAPDIGDLLSSPPVSKESKQQTESLSVQHDSESDDLTDLENVDFAKISAIRRSHKPESQKKPEKTRPVKKIAISAEEKAREKRLKAEAKDAGKERKRVERERAKEERALQKEKDKALAEVNKLRTDKKVSTPEMIVDIPASIHPGLKVQIEALLGDLDVQYETWSSTVEHVIKWRRKVTSRFNEDMGFWEPTPLRIRGDDHVLVILQAAEFVKFVLGTEGQDLEAHVLRMKTKFPNRKLIYLIEGLTPWMRKNRKLLNRQFASAVRGIAANAEQGSSSGQPRRRANNQAQEYIDEDKVEDGLLSLQVLHGTLVHHTNAPVETAQWVAIFTQHISTIPYRKARDASADAGFCMDAGQVRTGDGAKDTYIRMLQEISRVTAPIAYGIATKYATLPELVRGLEDEGPLALAECRKSANKDGALTDRTVGQAISRRVHKIFLGRDPTSTDI